MQNCILKLHPQGCDLDNYDFFLSEGQTSFGPGCRLGAEDIQDIHGTHCKFLTVSREPNPLTKLIIPPKKQLLSSPTLKDFTLLWADKYELCLNFRSWKFSLVCIGCGQDDFRQVFWCCGHSSAQPAGLNHDGKGTYAKVGNSPVGRSSHPKRKLKVCVW